MCKGGCACRSRQEKTIENMGKYIIELETTIENMVKFINDLDIDEDVCKKVDCPLGQYEINEETCMKCITKFFGGKNDRADD